MLTVVQPSRAATSVVDSRSAKSAPCSRRRPRARRRRARPVGPAPDARRYTPIEHLAVAARVAGCEDRPTAELGLASVLPPPCAAGCGGDHPPFGASHYLER